MTFVPEDNRIVAALLEDPALLALSPTLLAGDVIQRFDCSKRVAYLSVMTAYRCAPEDARVYALPPERRSF